MSRIIIIGNGFDIAHGLKTSYTDLMNFIKVETNPHNKRANDCGTIHHYFKNKRNDYVSFKYIPSERDYKFTTCPEHKSIYFLTLFQQFNHNQKWSDLETLYFNLISNSKSSLEYIKLTRWV